jgi:hypothetical protein
MSVDLKTLTPDTSLATTGFLFGADSQASASPSVYSGATVAVMVVAAQRPATFWSSGSNYFHAGTGLNLGGLSTEGSNAVALTSNGFRNNAGTWTSYGAGGGTGAAQIELVPTGEIRFRADTTKASGTAINPTTRLTIRGDGNFGIGSGGTANETIRVGNAITGAISGTAYGIRQNQTIQSDVTTLAVGNQVEISTVAASFPLTNLRYYRSMQLPFGAGSIVTNQSAFIAESSLIGAANNYGFHGTIPNHPQRTITNVERTSNVVTITTSVAHTLTVGQQVVIDATTNISLDGTFTVTAVPTTTTLQYAQAGTDIVSVADTGTVNSAGRFNLYMSGNAPNYMAGALSIGTITANAAALLDLTSTTRGLLLPRMTTAQRDAIVAPPDGLLIYNTSLTAFQGRAGGAWVSL